MARSRIFILILPVLSACSLAGTWVGTCGHDLYAIGDWANQDWVVVAACIITLGFACDGRPETLEEATVRTIWDVDEAGLSTELALLRPAPC